MKVALRSAKIHCTELLRALSIRVRVQRQGTSQKSGTLYLSNHLSYLDVLMLYSVMPTVFVTSVEVRDSFFLGTVTKHAFCYFVERRNRSSIQKDLEELKAILSQGFSLVLFPEGTSSNGESVLPFKTSLLQIAEQSSFPVQPLCIRYDRIDDEPFSNVNADQVCYYGDHEFFSHLLGVLRLKKIEAEIVFLDPVPESKVFSRKEISLHTHQKIKEAYASASMEKF